MQPFYIFGLRSVLIGFFFYGIYVFALKNKAPFNFIRFYLVLALVSMSVFPALPWLGVPFPKMAFLYNIPVKDPLNTILLRGVSVGLKPQAAHNEISLLLFAYISIAGIQIIRMLWSLISIVLLWSKSNKTVKEGLNIAITSRQVPVFSIFNWIFIDQETLNLNDAGLILAHEKLHIRQKHTYDLIFGELLRITLWFNPFIHLIIKEIKANHEFLADVSIIRTPEKLKNYQNLMVQLSTSVDFNILTHNFSYSLIKRRINMIKKPKRSMRRLKLYSLTALAMTGVLFACSTSPKMEKNQSATPTVSKTASSLRELTVTALRPDSAQVFNVVEKMPEYPGGMNALMNYLATNIHYPEKAKKQEIEGRVFINFVINKDGSVSNVRVLRGISPECDAEAVRVVEGMPKWIPGEQKGQPVRVRFNIPIKFALK